MVTFEKVTCLVMKPVGKSQWQAVQCVHCWRVRRSQLLAVCNWPYHMRFILLKSVSELLPLVYKDYISHCLRNGLSFFVVSYCGSSFKGRSQPMLMSSWIYEQASYHWGLLIETCLYSSNHQRHYFFTAVCCPIEIPVHCGSSH